MEAPPRCRCPALDAPFRVHLETVMSKSRRSCRVAVTSLEAARALHLDFEGFMGRPPVMAGLLVDGRWTAVVFDDVAPMLAPAAIAKGLEVCRLDDFLAEIVRRAEEEDRCIMGFSSRERSVFLEHGVTAETFDRRWIDTRRLGMAWRRRHHPEVAAQVTATRRRLRRLGRRVDGRGNRLQDFARLLGLPSCPGYGPGRTTSRLRDVGGQLERRGAYERLTGVAKRKWTLLLRHNEFDCRWSAALAITSADAIRRGDPRA